MAQIVQRAIEAGAIGFTSSRTLLHRSSLGEPTPTLQAELDEMQWWARDRPHGRIPLETVVHMQARATAEAVGFGDRGLLAKGYKADINVIDFEGLALHPPTIVDDLPAGGSRLIQGVTGIEHTFVSGVEIAADGESTGETPGVLVRGAQQL